MDYAESQRNPGKHMTGLTVVIVLHIILGWALLNAAVCVWIARIGIDRKTA